jgi:hypothetical protein
MCRELLAERLSGARLNHFFEFQQGTLEIALRQQLLRLSQGFDLIKPSDSSHPLQFRVAYSLHREKAQRERFFSVNLYHSRIPLHQMASSSFCTTRTYPEGPPRPTPPQNPAGKPPMGFEPMTSRLLSGCSTN